MRAPNWGYKPHYFIPKMEGVKRDAHQKGILFRRLLGFNPHRWCRKFTWPAAAAAGAAPARCGALESTRRAHPLHSATMRVSSRACWATYGFQHTAEHTLHTAATVAAIPLSARTWRRTRVGAPRAPHRWPPAAVLLRRQHSSHREPAAVVVRRSSGASSASPSYTFSSRRLH